MHLSELRLLRFALFTLAVSCSSLLSAQIDDPGITVPLPDINNYEGWNLVLEKQGVKIYTRKWPGSSFVAVKTVQTIQSSLSNIVGNYLEVESFPEWVRDMKSAKLLKDFNNQDERIVYMHMDMPWPLRDRDVAIGQRLSQNEDTLQVRIREWNEGDSLDQIEGIVRIPKVNSEFVLTPLADGGVEMVWQGHNEPGGIIPSFLVNWMIENIFYDSSLNMRERFESPEYQKVATGIVDPR